MSLEISTENMDNLPGKITAWLDLNYIENGTKSTYYRALLLWSKFIYGEDSIGEFPGHRFGQDKKITKRNVLKRINVIEERIDQYLIDLDDRVFINDYKEFIKWMRNERYANLTIRNIIINIKIYFERDPRCKIDKEVWRSLKRTLIPQSTRPSTQDDILTKEQLKKVLKHMSFHAKAMTLFLLSTGMRNGAACQIKMSDINLYSDPPEVTIRNEYTKGKIGGRVMWFSEEARDAIIDWHKHRNITMKKRGDNGDYDEDLVLNYLPNTFAKYWRKTLVRADEGAKPPVLAKRDT